MTSDGSLGIRGNLLATRFYAILDTAYVPAHRWVETCSEVIAGGADLVQVRAKGVPPAERERLLLQVLPLFNPTSGEPPFLIVNDDVELCERVPGVGLHIGQDDTAPEEARARIGVDRLLGLSTHSEEQARSAMGLKPGVLDYFCTGPVFPTQTKPDYKAVGLELVRWTADQQPELAWFCIGGITRQNLDRVVRAGATRVVIVSDILTDADPMAAVRAVKRAL